MITLEYRPVQPNDLNELKQLHELFFPLSYSDAFYNRAVKGIGIHGKRLYSIIVIDNIINENNIIIPKMVGFVLAQFINVLDCGDESLYYHSLFQIPKHNKVCYILTIGIIETYRKHGIATYLIKQVIQYAKSNSKCGCVYLHVIDYNKVAMQFYENNNFIKLRYIEEFYTIHNQPYSSYLYIYYMNDALNPDSNNITSNISNYFNNIWVSISNLFSFNNNSNSISDSISNSTSSINIVTGGSDGTDREIENGIEKRIIESESESKIHTETTTVGVIHTASSSGSNINSNTTTSDSCDAV